MEAGADILRRLLRLVRWPATSTIPLVLSRPPPNLHHNLPTAFQTSSPLWVILSITGSTTQPGTRRRRRVEKERQILSVDLRDHLSAFNIDVPKVVERYPPIASCDVQRVQRVTSFLAGLGIDMKRVLEVYPSLLAGKVEAYAAVVQLLSDRGVDAARVINPYPGVLHRRVATLQRALDAIESCGVCVADVVNRDPKILRLSASDLSSLQNDAAADPLQPQSIDTNENTPPTKFSTQMHSKATLLSSVGLEFEWFLKRMPRVLFLSMDKLKVRLDYLKSLGVDVPKVLRLAPGLLETSPASLQQRVQFLLENGMDVVCQVNTTPRVLFLSVERKLRPTVTFVVEEMGLSPFHMNGASNIWNYDLKLRLRPRFLYLKSLGRALPHLSHLGSLSDQRFVNSVAKTSLQHYYDWRQQNGFPAPALGDKVDVSKPTISAATRCNA
eukprot:EG_transcript_10781